MLELSILIPARNEKYLQKTIDDILEHSEAQIEILIGLDGEMSHINYPLSKNVHVISDYPSIGQRAMTNRLASLAKGKYLMKTDAHCSFGPGFDRIMLRDTQEDVILSPYMLVLDAENWRVRTDKRSSNFYFDRDLVMQYGIESVDTIVESMCLQGSCWMILKEKYWELELGDEQFTSWGSQGPELGLKAWLSGNRCLTTKNTYYAHMFRTTDTDFPYDRGLNPGKVANDHLKQIFLNDRWPRAVYKLDWLIDKFNKPGNWGYAHGDIDISQ